MAPGTKTEPTASYDGSKASNSATAAYKTEDAEAALKARLTRKRTKTGCLTCRRRRIKCGEERPVCRNCVKSKRHCEGYNQRVVFKPPHFDFRQIPNGGANVTFQVGTGPGPMAPMYAGDFEGQDLSSFNANLMPRPMGPAGGHYSQYQGIQSHQYPQVDYSQAHRPLAQQFENPAYHAQPLFQGPQSQFQYISQQTAAASQPAPVPLQPQTQRPQLYSADSILDGGSNQDSSPWLSTAGPSASEAAPYISPPMTASHALQPKQEYVWHNETPADISAGAKSVHASNEELNSPLKQEAFATDATRQQRISPPQVAIPDIPQTFGREAHQQPPSWSSAEHPQVTLPMLSSNLQFDYYAPEMYEHEHHAPTYETPTQLLDTAAVELFDENYYDVESDEEMETDKVALYAIANGQQTTLTRILAMNQINVQDAHSRAYDTFLYQGILDTYRVEQVANPLNNPATARIFAHFISATGPSLSVFERQPLNSSVLFTQGHIPFKQQGLWTYTMPMAALHHQGLLHAMLALASLHIARLQGAPVTSSMKHYAWALKRVHHCVGHPKKRLQLTTIAASMLLGFYEVMTADHMKWNSHLMGARQLFVETDFAGMAKQFRSMKRERALRVHTSGFYQTQPQDELLDQMTDVDDRTVSIVAGHEVRYDDAGEILTPGASIPRDLDLSKWEVLKDLYWWYCKQDAYQSIVSGNPLL